MANENASIVVENYAENPFHFPKIDMVKRDASDPQSQVMPVKRWELVFPGCRPGKDDADRDVPVPGVLAITEEQYTAMQNDPVMASWFGNGKLQLRTAPAPRKAPQKQ